MKTNRVLKKEKLGLLIKGVLKSDSLFVAPAIEARQVVYKAVAGVEDITFDYIVPRNSFKEFFFPQTEAIARYSMGKDHIELKGVEVRPKRAVIFGSRPCDSTSKISLRSVFTWDFIDSTYTKREDNSIVMTIACTNGDESCFCTTVGITPDSGQGSDILLRETESNDFTVEAITEKGRAFIEEFKDCFDEPAQGRPKKIFKPQELKGIDLERIKGFLKNKGHYDDPLWFNAASKCIGCGACTFSCPTCHCFDIADEGTYKEGERRKNWDACQFDFFTLHASGHNPRDTQYKRWRNRFMCKFNLYPEKFSTSGCVGCGRCIRVCPVRLDITEVMGDISNSR